MGNLYTYFAASTDEEAAATVGIFGGPDSRARVIELPSGELVDSPVFDTLEVGGIYPGTMLSTLEELLTTRSLEEIEQDERFVSQVGEAVGDVMVLAITDTLRDALAQADQEQLRRVAGAWVESEDFYGSTDASDAFFFLHELSELAVRARAKGHRLYCWLST